MACRDCVWWSRSTPREGDCDWMTLAILPFWIDNKQRRVRETGADSGTDCPAFKPREGE